MADIRIQRKKSSRWPWIIAALLLLLAIWAAVEFMDRDKPEAANPTPTETALPVPGPATE